MKRWGLGTYHGLRRKHADTYLNEFVFRYNRRFYRHASFELGHQSGYDQICGGNVVRFEYVVTMLGQLPVLVGRNFRSTRKAEWLERENKICLQRVGRYGRLNH